MFYVSLFHINSLVMHLNQRMLWIDDFSYVICHLFVFIAIFVGVEIGRRLTRYIFDSHSTDNNILFSQRSHNFALHLNFNQLLDQTIIAMLFIPEMNCNINKQQCMQVYQNSRHRMASLGRILPLVYFFG